MGHFLGGRDRWDFGVPGGKQTVRCKERRDKVRHASERKKVTTHVRSRAERQPVAAPIGGLSGALTGD